MEARPICFLDSGIGGLPYLAQARHVLPGYRFAYFADTAHFPYGEQGAGELQDIVVAAVRAIISAWNPCMVVVACNTASVVALDLLRSEFDLPFVGVVPAVKPAALVTSNGTIGLLATERTVSDPYVSQLIRDYAPAHTVHMIAASGLVEAIEAGEFIGEAQVDENYLRGPLEQLSSYGVDSVVLGCTHFVHVRQQIERLLGPGIAVVDSVDGVARQVARVTESCNCERTGASEAELSCSGSVPDSYRMLASRFRYRLVNSSSVA
jgi:glutamate racemase